MKFLSEFENGAFALFRVSTREKSMLTAEWLGGLCNEKTEKYSQRQWGRDLTFILTTINTKITLEFKLLLKVMYLESFGTEKCILEASRLSTSGVMNPEMQFSRT